MKTSISFLYGLRIALFVMIIVSSDSIVIAQKPIGLYLTVNDFKRNELSFTKTKNYKIRLREFSFKHPIRIIQGDSILRLSKDSVYGYKDSDGHLFRFYKKDIYPILNSDTSLTLYKILISSKTKYAEAKYGFYFSRSATDSLVLLTIQNLENVFKDNQEFIDCLERDFNGDNELLQYDTRHHMYKINYLLKQSITKNKK
ncbi:MAG: hypothetical protein HYX39_09850 [Bacteroidetes bacterium]|nr:hypothetical protein [Bacteroidota bacterium]